MASKTDDILQKLLDSIDTDGGPEKILTEHRSSKGPLYSALGKATAIIQERLDRQMKDLEQTKQELSSVESRTQELSAQVENLTKNKEHLSQSLTDVKGKVGECQGVLDHVRQLEATGFKLYEQFRPAIAGGKKGWGAKGQMSLAAIENLAKGE